MTGTTALVTGASSGIGAAIATALLQQGLTVICVGRRQDGLDALTDRFGQLAIATPCDLANAAALNRLVYMVGERQIDVLVNNAGHDAGGGVAFDSTRPEDWSDTVAVNLVAAMRLTHAVLPGFLARDDGHVVTIGSVVTRASAPGLAAYAATKHGLHGLMEGLRIDYCDTGLRFTEIVPGVVRSGFAGRRLQDGVRADAFYEAFAATLAPEDIARAVWFAVQQPADCAVEEIVLMPTRRHRP